MRAFESFMNTEFIETYGDCVFMTYGEFQEFTKKCVQEFTKEFGEYYSSAEVSELENEAYANGRQDESEDDML